MSAGSGAATVAALLGEAASHYRAGRHGEGLRVCRRALAIDPHRPDALALAGALAFQSGEIEEAAAHYAAAVARKPDFAEAQYNLGNALLRLERGEAAVAAYRAAARFRPDLVPIHNNLGTALQSLRRFDEAAAAYRAALALAPNAAELHRNLAIVLHEAGDRDGAIAAFRQALALKPDWESVYRSLANALLEKGDWRAARDACDASLRLSPGNIEALGLKSLALDEMGDRAGARYLVDFDRFVRTVEFTAAPEGFAGMAEFNAALARHALTHPTLRLPPKTDAHYHCPTLRITDEFLAEPKGPAASFERMIEQAVSDYVARIAQADPTHPYLVNPPRRWQLTSWAAVLDGEGNLNPHVHYDGYVSGVYYAQIPQPIGAPGQGNAGWFELGASPSRFPCKTVPQTLTIEPRPGLMILFPSYFYHRTLPFTAPEPRISIAF
ncbi:MAG TPA: tetratricopeptide repeat protein, partial [Stellaceae bacterium]